MLNNSVYGKTIENIKNRVNVKLICNEKEFDKAVLKPYIKNLKVIDSGLTSVQNEKTVILFN